MQISPMNAITKIHPVDGWRDDSDFKKAKIFKARQGV